MPRLKALLVGVPSNPSYPLLDMPSARRDVQKMYQLLSQLPGVEQGSQCLRLPHPNVGEPEHRQTNKATILHYLREFLFNGARPGDQLVFYFSGHGLLCEDPQDPARVDELLCPSDANPNLRAKPTPQAPNPRPDATARATLIHADEVVDLAHAALKAGACLEIIIEACSAAGFIKAPTHTIYPFGCYFGGSHFPGGSGAVWSASLIGENSHAGPVPACSNAEPVGLFTHYFCENFKDRSRLDLLTQIKLGLSAYAKACNADCCKEAPNSMGTQTPKLYCYGGLEAPPFSATCQTRPDVPVGVPTSAPSGTLVVSGSTAPALPGSLASGFAKKPVGCGPATLPQV